MKTMGSKRMLATFLIACGVVGHAALCGSGAMGTIAANERGVSLRDFAGEETWIGDFRYKRVFVKAQRQECVAYTMEMKIRHVESLRERNLPWFLPTASADEEMVIGRSGGWSEDPRIDPQPIYGYMITDTNSVGPKLKVVLVGSNHAHEPPACWTLHGLVEFLVSDDPRAETLRRHAVFYVYPVVNPDGKVAVNQSGPIRSVNGNPELRAAGKTNHNRVWDTDGQFTSIDVVKAALRKDTDGTVDYLLDIHGIPLLSLAFAREESARSPLASVLMSRVGFTLRPGGDAPGMLRSWVATNGDFIADYVLTPEMENGSEAEMLRRGKEMALAFHDVVTGRIPPPRGLPKSTAEPEEPPPPNARISSSAGEFEMGNVLRDPTDLTVAVWITGTFDSRDSVPILTWRDSEGENLSWMLAQRPGTQQMIVILSADGSRTRSVNKRFLSAGWPGFDVFDGTPRLVAFTFEAGGEGTLRLFIDGAELKAGGGLHIFDNGDVPSLYTADGPVVFGQRTAQGFRFLESIGEVAIWDSALSPGGIRWVFQNGFQETSP